MTQNSNHALLKCINLSVHYKVNGIIGHQKGIDFGQLADDVFIFILRQHLHNSKQLTYTKAIHF